MNIRGVVYLDKLLVVYPNQVLSRFGVGGFAEAGKDHRPCLQRSLYQGIR
jgi:hypothetical protein